MKEIIYSPDYINHDIIKIRKNTPVLNYLLKNNIQFKLQQVTPNEFELLKELNTVEFSKITKKQKNGTIELL